jgi:hypothetical protein
MLYFTRTFLSFLTVANIRHQVCVLMALRTEGYEILFRITAQAAPCEDMMNLKVHHSSTLLAAPSISRQNSQAKLTVGFWFKP